MKGASLARMYFLFIGTWRLKNIENSVFIHTKIEVALEVAVTISYLNLALSKFLLSW